MEIVPYLFYPLLASVLVVIVGAVSIYLASKFFPRLKKITIAVFLALFLASVVAVFIYMSKYYAEEISVSGYYPSLNTLGLVLSLIGLTALLVGFYAFSNKGSLWDTRSIVYGAICIATSSALSFIRLFKLPQGGSVTLASLLPLMVYCLVFGTRRGIVVCCIYGILQAVQDPFIIHPIQFLLDYVVAYGFIGISGLFVEKDRIKIGFVAKFALGAILAVLFRYLSHALSGVFAFADYIGDGYTALGWTFAYNAFALVDMAISIVAGVGLLSSRQVRRILLSPREVAKRRTTVSQSVQDGEISSSNESETTNQDDETEHNAFADVSQSENGAPERVEPKE